jgi:hypothetical protein
VGWLLRRDVWGQGYATEAARACLEWGFAALPVSYITAMIHPENTRSTQVAGRLGFKPAREDVLLGDPVIIHRVEREDWTRQCRHTIVTLRQPNPGRRVLHDHAGPVERLWMARARWCAGTPACGALRAA